MLANRYDEKMGDETKIIANSLDCGDVTPTDKDGREGKADVSLMRPLALPQLAIPELIPRSVVEDIVLIGNAVGQLLQQATAALMPAVKFLQELNVTPAFEFLQAIGASIRRSEQIERAGWLPHYTTPFDAMSDKMTPMEIGEVIEKHYQDNWTEVEKEFLARIEGFPVDEEAKATFREALCCHAGGFFRSVPRTLFPEIERVACAELYQGNREHWINGDDGKTRKTSITSLPEFAKTVGQLPIDQVMTIDYGYALYMKLEDHLYEAVRSSEQIAKAMADTVPNRHASLHGIVSYNTMKSSMNALIMTDFIFHLIGQIKAQGLGEE